MSKKDEALTLALEALEYIYEGANNQGPHTGISWRCVSNKAEPVISALREALAEPQEKYTYGTPLLDAMTGKESKRWAVFCQGCRKEWTVSYPHPGKSICADCDDKLAEQPAQQDPSAGTQVSKVWWDGEKLMARQVPLEDFYKPAQHRAWFTVDELNAWADKKLKENPQWEEQPAQVDPCIDGSCSCCWVQLDEQPAQQEPVNKYCCHLCFNNSGQVFLDRMILCPECGNKRCPKATHHGLPCTKSNDLGQKGSIYDQPAQRTWVGLTDEERKDIELGMEVFGTSVEDVLKEAEAKLREKNNG